MARSHEVFRKYGQVRPVSELYYGGKVLPMSMGSHEEKALRERLWSHTVGIANRALVTTGKDPVTGLPAREEETPGTGVAGKWNDHYFILTAGHVLMSANPADLNFFVRERGDLQNQHASEVNQRDASEPIPLGDPTAIIHRCHSEDLALITIGRNVLGPLIEFFDFEGESVDPEEGEIVVGVGYPVGNSVRFHQQVGSVIQGTIVLSPTPFSGTVLSDVTGGNFNKFDPTQHYLTTYESIEPGTHPSGISGAAVWVKSNEDQTVWAARLKFAGICTSCYRNGTIEQIVRASTVRQFLSDIFGPLK